MPNIIPPKIYLKKCGFGLFVKNRATRNVMKIIPVPNNKMNL